VLTVQQELEGSAEQFTAMKDAGTAWYLVGVELSLMLFWVCRVLQTQIPNSLVLGNVVFRTR